jgi:hypothetical protein
MRLARFNNKGIQEFRNLLEDARRGELVTTPLAMLENAALVEQITDGPEFAAPVCTTRGELATVVDQLLDKVSLEDDMNDMGLWAWLAAAFLDSLCPTDENGKRQPKTDYRYIPSTDYRHFYRHLVRNPVRIRRLFAEIPNAASIILCQHPAIPGEFVEQLSSRQERITNPSIIAAANRLYFDVSTGKPKRGAAPNWRKPGTLRRFFDILDQLDLTYDLYSMSTEDLLALLPGEFADYVG